MTVSIRASLLLSALAMAALTAAFVDPPETPDHAKAPVNPAHLTAGGEDGSERGTELASDNQSCATGLQQPSINLGSATTVKPSRPEAELPTRCAP